MEQFGALVIDAFALESQFRIGTCPGRSVVGRDCWLLV